MIGTKRDLIEWLREQPDGEKLYEVSGYHEKRSRNANSYAWALIGKIADVLRASKEYVYKEMLKYYGQSELVDVLCDVNVDGYFKYFDEVGRVVRAGKSYTRYCIYKGSSEFTTREMSIFIDGIVDTCKELSIETLTPGEIMRLKEAWQCQQ